ncbi:HAD domain-containing protein [Streptomyces sp. NPDC007872]|uniref:HAD domain-containing protein n=1 Tax=Streptomyces sp. NPDC007872 TaxID=3364782 RepID=UPI0036BA3844
MTAERRSRRRNPSPLPLLFLDVDGPLIPFGGPSARHPEGYPTYLPPAGRPDEGMNPLLARVDPGLGPRLAATGCELVWATTWMDDANAYVAPWLGLPELPVVFWPDETDEDMAERMRTGRHWKTRPLVARAAGRPFVWVDDEITGADRAWVAVHHSGRALLHRVDPRDGLTDTDFEALAEWLDGLAGQGLSGGSWPDTP